MTGTREIISPETFSPSSGDKTIRLVQPRQGGLPWGLRTIQTHRLQACLQIGRLQSDQIGALGQDGAFANDGRFRPIPLHTNFPCGQTDAHGYLFLNVFEQETPASASLANHSRMPDQPAAPETPAPRAAAPQAPHLPRT
jgi:hypothetical protein